MFFARFGRCGGHVWEDVWDMYGRFAGHVWKALGRMVVGRFGEHVWCLVIFGRCLEVFRYDIRLLLGHALEVKQNQRTKTIQQLERKHHASYDFLSFPLWRNCPGNSTSVPPLPL